MGRIAHESFIKREIQYPLMVDRLIFAGVMIIAVVVVVYLLSR
ncbi:MAG: hypothetical protein WC717_05635 [Candidatus Micrarchaeia archaeon]|jgi:hypothetical protein